MLNIIIEAYKGPKVALYVNGLLIRVGTPTQIVKVATTIRQTQVVPAQGELK